MNFFFKILKTYINSSIHVALAVVSFVCITYLDFNLIADKIVLVFVFSSTIIAYTLVKYIPLINQVNYRPSNSVKFTLALSLISLIPLLFSLFYFRTDVLIFISLIVLLTLLYMLPFLPKAKNLRDISGLKIFIIALVWTATTVILPFLSNGIDLSSFDVDMILYTMSRFLIVISLTIPFEIRDLKLDHIYLNTLPQVLGVFTSKALAIGLVVLSSFLLNSIEIDTLLYMYVHIFIILLILFSKRRQGFFYTAFLVESVPIIWFLLKYFLG